MAIDFSHGIHTFVPKFGQNSHFLFLKVPMGGRGSTGLANSPKKQFFEGFAYTRIGIKQFCALDAIGTSDVKKNCIGVCIILRVLCHYSASSGVLGACRNSQADIEFPSLIMTPPVKKMFHDVSVVHLAIYRAASLSYDIR